jgi:hypothetical protein
MFLPCGDSETGRRNVPSVARLQPKEWWIPRWPDRILPHLDSDIARVGAPATVPKRG